MMVLSLCAMVNTVRSANSRRIVCWMSSSVSRSTAAVASSRTKILLLRSSARAKHTNCRWPTLWKKNYIELLATQADWQHKILELCVPGVWLILRGESWYRTRLLFVNERMRNGRDVGSGKEAKCLRFKSMPVAKKNTTKLEAEQQK